VQSLLCGMNKCPSQSTGSDGLASISTVSSISESDVVVVIVDDGGRYVDACDVVGSYIGCSVTVVDSISTWPTSVMIVCAPINRKK